ncbi:MAG: hypothetical protein FJ267_11020, partial [Planctomycetes bacterium]|nr:hypothetical protein [Planctomycetota bacterium]
KAAGESMDDEWMKSLALTMARDIDRGIEPQSVVHALGLPSPISHALRESTSPESMVEILHGLGDIYAARTEVNSTLVATVVEPLVMASIVSLLVLLVIAIFMPLIKLLNDLS